MYLKWSPLKCISFLFFFFSFPAFAEIPSVLKKIEKRYSVTKTVKADFVQEKTLSSMGIKKPSRSKGFVWIKYPDRYKWQTTHPDQNLLVSNGQKIWFHTPPFDPQDPEDRGQVHVRKASQAQSRLASLLLSAKFSEAKDMKIKQKSKNQFEFLPKKGTAGTVKKIEISFNLEQGYINEVILSHSGGNRTKVQLKNIRLGEEISDGTFHFKPSPTDEVIVE